MKRCHSRNVNLRSWSMTVKGACHTLEQVQVVGDLLQDHEAGQDEAHRALQALIHPLASIWPVPLALLHTHSDSIIPIASICLQPVPRQSTGATAFRPVASATPHQTTFENPFRHACPGTEEQLGGSIGTLCSFCLKGEASAPWHIYCRAKPASSARLS